MTLRVYREDTAGLDGTFNALLAYARKFCCWGVPQEGACPACKELLFIEMMTNGVRQASSDSGSAAGSA